MLDNIPQKIRQDVEYFIKEKGFEVKEVQTSESFGNFYVVLTSDDFWMSLISDRSQEFVNLSNDQGNKWIFIEHIRIILNPNISRVNLYIYRFEESINFVKENYSAILNLFSNENITETKRLLKKWFNY
ncbi:MAG: hypothetical protein ABFD91_08435 [Anaerohalosphaeraceae bacterium]